MFYIIRKERDKIGKILQKPKIIIILFSEQLKSFAYLLLIGIHKKFSFLSIDHKKIE